MSEKKESKLGGFLKDNKEVVTGVVGSMAKGLLKGIGKSLGGYFSSFKQGGFRCLGKQAFHQGDLQKFYDFLQKDIDAVKDTPQSVADFLSRCNRNIVESDLEIGRYRSPCSKQNRQAYKETVQNVVNSYDKSGFRTELRSATDFKGVTYQYTHYIPIDEYFNPPKVETPEVVQPTTLDGEAIDNNDTGNSLVDENGNLLDNIDPALYTPGFIGHDSVIDELELVGRKRDPSYNIGIGGRTGDGTDWNISVGKEPREDNTMKYLLLGLLGLVAYKVLFDKK